MRLHLTVLAIGLAALLTGCQGESETTFAGEANLICEGQYADFANSLASIGYVTSRAEDAATREERVEASAEATAKLAELEPPPEDEDVFRAYIAERRSQQVTAVAARRALESGDDAAFRAAELALLQHDRRMRGYEARLGLDICAQDLDEEAEDAVREVLEAAFLEAEPDCDVFTPYFTRKALGSPDCELLADDLLPEEISIRALRGSEGEVASAEVHLTGGPDDGAVYGVRLLYDRWAPAISDLLRISRPPPPAGS